MTTIQATATTAPMCAVESCDRTVHTRVWCRAHYQRWLRTGSPLGVYGDVEARFLARVDKNGPLVAGHEHLGPCWIWIGADFGNGYGQFSVDNVNWKAYRWAYVRWVGPIPEGLELDHLCHTFSLWCDRVECPHHRCVNPTHLEPVTHLENVLRGRQNRRNATHCGHGHEFKPENTRIDRNGTKRCRRCDREGAARRFLVTANGGGSRG